MSYQYQQSFQAASGQLRDSESFMRRAARSEESPEGQDGDASLEDAARTEQEYLRERLRAELQREPTDEEMNEWLREHTEGY